MKEIARMMIVGGGILVLIGVIIYFAGNYFKWFGRLPGDIRIEKPGFSFYAPIVSMLILSGIISLLIWLFRKLF
jgi:hypothetical protein